MADEILTSGFERWTEMLAMLKGAVRPIVRRSFRKVLKPIQKDAKSNAPRGETGALKQSIKIRAGKFSRKRIVMRLTTGDRTLKAQRFYSAFNNFGFKPGKRPGNQSNEATEPTNFIRDAVDANESQTESILVREVGQELEREARAAL